MSWSDLGDSQSIFQWPLGSSIFYLVSWRGREKAVFSSPSNPPPSPSMLLDSLEPWGKLVQAK